MKLPPLFCNFFWLAGGGGGTGDTHLVVVKSNAHPHVMVIQQYSQTVVFVEGQNSFHSWEDNPFKKGNPEVRSLESHFSESELAILQYSQTVVFVEGWYSFHSWGDGPFINGSPKVEYLYNHFSESKIFPVETLENSHY